MFNNDSVNTFQAKDFLPSVLLTALSLLLFALSYVGYIHHSITIVLWFALLVIIALGTMIKFEFGLLAITLELFLGGHGYLFSFPLFGFVISFRIALFCIVGFFWLLLLLRTKQLPRICRLPINKPFILMCVILFSGVIIGLINHHGKLVFFDGNAYVAFLLIPMFVDGIQNIKQIKRLVKVAVSSAFAVALITILFLGIYSVYHYDDSLRSAITLSDDLYAKLNNETLDGNIVLGQGTNLHSAETQLNPLFLTKTKPISYRWLLDTGSAEISYISGRFFRIFFPSQMYLLITLFCSLTAALFLSSRRSTKLLLFFVSVITLAALFIGYSRSYWLGLLVGSLLFIVGTFLNSKKKKAFLVVTGLVLLLVIAVFFSTNLLSSFSSRFETIFSPKHDVASAHRIQLAKGIWNMWQKHPLIGSGFGTTIVFPTIYANGKIFPTAFYVYEWAYFDVAVKTGLLGLGAFLWLLSSIAKSCIQSLKKERYLGFAILSGLVALCVANITTPVFTHPLGIGALAILSCFIFYDTVPNTSRHVE